MSDGLRFDIAIGNPPYQNNDGSKIPLWPECVLATLRHVKRGGTFAQIHPSNWRGQGGRSITEKAAKTLRALDIEWLKMVRKQDCKKTFANVETPFDVYVIRNQSTPGFWTEMEGTDGSEFGGHLRNAPFIPNFKNADLAKCIAEPWEERVRLLHGMEYEETNLAQMSIRETPHHCHPCIYTISEDAKKYPTPESRLKLRWSDVIRRDRMGRPHHFGTPKLCFVDWQRSGIPFADVNGDYGMCPTTFGLLDDTELLPRIGAAMHSKRFRKMMEAVRFNTHDWNIRLIAQFKRDFWRLFEEED